MLSERIIVFDPQAGQNGIIHDLRSDSVPKQSLVEWDILRADFPNEPSRPIRAISAAGYREEKSDEAIAEDVKAIYQVAQLDGVALTNFKLETVDIETAQLLGLVARMVIVSIGD